MWSRIVIYLGLTMINLKTIVKSIFLLLATVYVYYVGQDPINHFIVHSVHLIFHEAGHFICMFSGSQFIHVAGGTLMQLLIPIILGLYFCFVRKDVYAMSFMFLWLGSSLFDVAVYAKDAIYMNLDLFGGDGVIHDWNYLLDTLGVLKYTSQIAKFIYSLGMFSIIIGAIWGVYNLFSEKKEIDTV